MRRVPFDPVTDLDDLQRKWWENWTKRAAIAQAAIITAYKLGEAISFNGAIWTELKEWLLENVFAEKCAYCEVKISPGFFGDGEHYRPKGNVTVVDGTGKRKVVSLQDGNRHPGYYWLAYDWRNLLPACSKCNNTKSDQFPVAAAHLDSPVDEPDALNDKEQPLLINPYFEDPGKYIVFGRFGIIAPLDGNARGRATIEVFGLNRRELVEERWGRQSEAVEGLAPLVTDIWRNVANPNHDALRDRWVGRGAPFSASVNAVVKEGLQVVDQLYKCGPFR
jgi:hypothetical protein